MATKQDSTAPSISTTGCPRTTIDGQVAHRKSARILGLRSKSRTTSTAVKGNLPPRRRPNAEVRSREYLTSDEVDRLIAASRKIGRHRHRDASMILIAFRHALRVCELTHLRWDQIDLKEGWIHVRRAKNGTASVHPLRGPEIRDLRRLQREYGSTPYVFVTERGGPITTSTVRKLVARAGRQAEIPFPVHPHMLRHACGYKLANDGQDTRAIQQYLGHKNITHTVRYTELAPDRFNSFWQD